MEVKTGGKKTKRYFYTYEQYDKEGKGADTMMEDILADPELSEVTELIIGEWGDTWEKSCQKMLDGIVDHAECFSRVESLFIGDMGYEECEVSWIMQGDYTRLWTAMPQLRELTIKGSTDLILGQIRHENLESLSIICGGLPVSVIKEIQEAKLPNLKKLLLYIGVEEYGFDGDEDTVRQLLEKSDFPKLEYLGITDSEMQDELVPVVLDSKYMKQIHTLDLSNGTLTDKGGEILLAKLPDFPNISKLDIHYNYLTNQTAQQIERLSIETDVSECCEPEEYDGELFMSAMLTE